MGLLLISNVRKSKVGFFIPLGSELWNSSGVGYNCNLKMFLSQAASFPLPGLRDLGFGIPPHPLSHAPLVLSRLEWAMSAAARAFSQKPCFPHVSCYTDQPLASPGVSDPRIIFGMNFLPHQLRRENVKQGRYAWLVPNMAFPFFPSVHFLPFLGFSWSLLFLEIFTPLQLPY